MQTIASPASPLAKIDALALRLKQRRDELQAVITKIDDDHTAVTRKHRPALREAFAKCEGAQAALHTEIQANPDLFVKPRTFTLHGVKVGFAKGKGRLVIVNEAKTIELAKKHLDPEQVALVVRVTEAINKKAAAGLTAAELKKIGMHIEEASDEVVLSFVDSALDVLLARLLEQSKDDGA